MASKELIRETVIAYFSRIDGALIDGRIEVMGPDRYTVTLTGNAEGLSAEVAAQALVDVTSTLRALSQHWGIPGI